MPSGRLLGQLGTLRLRAWLAIALAVEGGGSAPFLTHEQKRKIFHDNAARFLGLEPGAPAP
jgi:hypothetical protein